MNSSIVIALPKIDDAKKIRTILNRHGFSVAAVCSTASTALASMSELDGGILICGYKLTDRITGMCWKIFLHILKCCCWHLEE